MHPHTSGLCVFWQIAQPYQLGGGEMSVAEGLKAKLRKLNAREVIELEQFVSERVQRQAVTIAMERRAAETTHCVRCGMAEVMLWGQSNAGTQRFRRRSCKVSFGSTTNTSLFHLRNRHLWSKYLGLMGRQIPVSKLQALPTLADTPSPTRNVKTALKFGGATNEDCSSRLLANSSSGAIGPRLITPAGGSRPSVRPDRYGSG